MRDKVQFCYRIEKEAGLAQDNETGELVPTYAKISYNVVCTSSADYQKAHLDLVGSIAEIFDIRDELVTPISQEEYCAEADEGGESDGR